ncbi:TnsA endonuclease N-terminal domain-containing protein [Brevibacillus invocatus]|uniref:TnsA endonuclease N-terminal domain-containing protein n=1 Tax=Brevibacillus invocatus TaxID=173959 RepID=UPI00203AAD2B|nr:TnsA endonuclease N-terminal domain-containing protein [Brevibacillus invocatus]MCM3081677.1 TnsA endonuclease N-terminal domain-containing protein [Brevibacillus invocatus]MCM3432085.1 TnsA endonuclease N-terminal domain-containing protein [Brevibacillus invocatus]
MAKRKRQITGAKIEKYIKEGRGQGIGKDYLPWLEIQDVPSEGRATRGKGWTTNRRHEFMSDLERDYFYILDFTDEVTDIREQYPLLPLEETMMIAEKIGVKHSNIQNKDEPVVLTTDFLITVGNKNVARTVKPASELEDKRTIEKFEIERRYWESRHVDWGIITDLDIPDYFVRNIEWVHKEFHNEDVPDLGSFVINQLQNKLAKHLLEGETIARSCWMCDEQLGLEVGTSLALFRHFIARKIWSVNMNERIVPTLKAKDFQINESFKSIQAKGG